MLIALFSLSTAWAGSLTLGTGTVVVVTDLGSSDPNKAERGALIGEVCAVGKTPLVSTGDGWWKGSLACANGVVYSTSAVQVAVPGTTAQPRSVSATAIASQIDKTIKFDASATPAVSTVVAAPPPPAPTVAPSESLRRVVRPGEAVRIVALSPEDAYYSDREGIVGKTCYPTDEMSYNIVANPVHIRDLHATLLNLLGFDHERLSFKFQGLDQRLTGVEPAKIISEIFA